MANTKSEIDQIKYEITVLKTSLQMAYSDFARVQSEKNIIQAKYKFLSDQFDKVVEENKNYKRILYPFKKEALPADDDEENKKEDLPKAFSQSENPSRTSNENEERSES